MGGFGVMSECDCSKTQFYVSLKKSALVETIPSAVNVVVGGTSSKVTVVQYDDTVSLNCGNHDGSTFCGARKV